MKTIIWNIFVGILVVIAIIGDIQMVNSLEKTSPEENYITQDDIDRATNSNDLIIKAIKKEGF
ncbi:MAG: hypothetical protein IJY61_03990 [Candidatus Gastranaerophilales bacterium]|nr:hypothetical protein [Candidatus Gastranaerophilales bacterium]